MTTPRRETAGNLAPQESNLPLARAREVLDQYWQDADGFTMPHPVVYPGLWLWDSCFHSLIWSALGDANRAIRELQAVFAGQTPDGFVPHMNFGRDRACHADLWQTVGPSTITQPPMYGHALAVLARSGTPVDALTGPATRAMWYLLNHRAAPCGLLRVFHPWESGTDDSPRWGSWQHDLTDRQEWWQAKGAMVRGLRVQRGAAVASNRFDVCPASWNALVAWNAAELASVTGDAALTAAADRLARRLDELAWDKDVMTWADVSPAGEIGSVVRTVDALLGVLTTTFDERAAATFDQLTDPDSFGTRFGPTGVHPCEPSYDPDRYWRGGAWPPMDYLFRIAADRWGRRSLADQLLLSHTQASQLSGYSEYRHPHTGNGLGATPQAWGFLPLVACDPGPPMLGASQDARSVGLNLRDHPASDPRPASPDLGDYGSWLRAPKLSRSRLIHVL